VDTAICTLCGMCEGACRFDAIRVDDRVRIDLSRCTGCGECEDQCQFDAIEMKSAEVA
jgi:heterodisulfide reductase subunit A-like polyferredoxin